MDEVLCGQCGHPRREHIPQKDCVDCPRYPGQCNLCTCSMYQAKNLVTEKLIQKNEEYFDAHRRVMVQYRITFGWGQPHGPGREGFDGHYATIWAPDSETAAMMANVRYNGIWSFIYTPDKWAAWSNPDSAMHGCKELEQLQYWSMSQLREYPATELVHRGAHVGSGRP